MDFTVRPERLPTLVMALEKAMSEIQAALPPEQAIAPPGADPASVAVAEHLGVRMFARHREAHSAFQAGLVDAISAMNDTMTEYLARETGAVATFGGRP
jgi:hypothetical protein